MAKGSDNLAGSFDSENTGGLLSGLLAEEETLDRHALWRLGSWGAGAVGAVIVGVLANQSQVGWRHEQVAAADLARQSQQIQAVAKESQNETRRLSSAIDTLNGDRDRLYSRVTVLEQGMDSATGAIARQKSTTASPPAAPAAAATPPMSAAAAVQAATQSPNPPPVIGPVATASSADKPHTEAANTPPASPPTVASVAPETANTPAAATTPAAAATTSTAAATPGATPTAAATPAATPATPSTPLMESKSMMAPPDEAAGKLIEPEAPKNEAPKNADAATPPSAPDVVASAPSAAGAEPDSTQAISPPAVQRTEFAVDVGGANSVGGLRALWRGLLKSRANAPLAGLQPIIVVKESNTGLGMQLRLVAGPLGDAAAAARICATMVENKRPCETTVFDGQRLAMKAGDEPPASAASAAVATKLAPDKPAAAKPASVRPTWHRHSYAKRAMIEDPAKKPDPPSTLSTLSSYFGSSKSAK